MSSLPNEDPAHAYHVAERRLRELLFGDGTFTPGMVKGEERRLELTRVLKRMRDAFDAAASAGDRERAEIVEALIADLEQEVRTIAARSREHSAHER